MPGLFLPARSLRGRPASLSIFPDGAGCRLSKRLIWWALLAIRGAVSGARTLFLPALREGRSGPRPLAQQDPLLAGQHELALLVVDCGRQSDDAGRALRRQGGDLEHRIESVCGIDRLQEFRGLLDKGDQRVADLMSEGTGARRGKAQDLESVRQRPPVAAL